MENQGLRPASGRRECGVSLRSPLVMTRPGCGRGREWRTQQGCRKRSRVFQDARGGGAASETLAKAKPKSCPVCQRTGPAQSVGASEQQGSEWVVGLTQEEGGERSRRGTG